MPGARTTAAAGKLGAATHPGGQLGDGDGVPGVDVGVGVIPGVWKGVNVGVGVAGVTVAVGVGVDVGVGVGVDVGVGVGVGGIVGVGVGVAGSATWNVAAIWSLAGFPSGVVTIAEVLYEPGPGNSDVVAKVTVTVWPGLIEAIVLVSEYM